MQDLPERDALSPPQRKTIPVPYLVGGPQNRTKETASRREQTFGNIAFWLACVSTLGLLVVSGLMLVLLNSNVGSTTRLSPGLSGIGQIASIFLLLLSMTACLIALMGRKTKAGRIALLAPLVSVLILLLIWVGIPAVFARFQAPIRQIP